MDKAKTELKSDATDAEKLAYNQLAATYNQSVSAFKRTKKTYFVSSASTFFSTYFPIVVLLGIAFAVNQKIDYKKENKSN